MSSEKAKGLKTKEKTGKRIRSTEKRKPIEGSSSKNLRRKNWKNWANCQKKREDNLRAT